MLDKKLTVNEKRKSQARISGAFEDRNLVGQAGVNWSAFLFKSIIWSDNFSFFIIKDNNVIRGD